MISVTGISHSFSDKQVLKDLSFEIRKGEFYSLLGPNGAGKTTSISLLCGLIPLQAGTISINGINIKKDPVAVKRLLGVVPQEISLYEELTGLENLVFWGSLYGIQKNTLKQRAKVLLERFGLTDRMNDKVKKYSGGMKRRINIASSLLHEPLIVFMDEPTVGIDPQSRNNIYDALAELKKEGKTILYTTHYMEEAERFSDRVGIIDHGTMLAMGTLAELHAKTGNKETLSVSVENLDENIKQKINSSLHAFQPEWDEQSCVLQSSRSGNDFKIILNAFIDAGTDIRNIEKHQASLETLFLQLTGKSLRD